MSASYRDLTADDVDALQELLESDPEYAAQITGYPPGPSDALSALMSVPPNFDPVGKRGVGLWVGGRLVAFADVLIGYPDPHTAYIGLLMVHGALRRQGLGGRLHRALERHVSRGWSIRRLRIGIISTTGGASEPFWSAMGYASTGEERPYRYGPVIGTTTLWERSVTNSPPVGVPALP